MYFHATLPKAEKKKNDIEPKKVFLIRYATEKKWLDEKTKIPTNKLTQSNARLCQKLL